MAINLGTVAPSAFYVGSTSVSAIYLGSTLVWPEGTPPPPTSDPFFGYVVLLLRGDSTGANVVDSSMYTKTLAASGTTQTTTNGRSLWGNSSWLFGGNGQRITTPDNDTFFQLGAEDYVVEAWLYITTLNTSGGGNFFSQAAQLSNNNNRQFSFAANSSGLQAYWTTDGVSDQSRVFSASLPTSQWFHVAFARSSGQLRAYVNGAQVGSTQSNNFQYFNSTADVCVGTFGKYAQNGYGFLDFEGYIDDFRLTVSSARDYTGTTITVPTQAFPNTGPPLTEKLSITRTNNTSTFGGKGTRFEPFARTAQLSIDNVDGMSKYKFTALATGTVNLRFEFHDDDESGYVAYVKKRATDTSADTEFGSYGAGIHTVSIPVVAGNVITLTGSELTYSSFSKVTAWAI